MMLHNKCTERLVCRLVKEGLDPGAGVSSIHRYALKFLPQQLRLRPLELLLLSLSLPFEAILDRFAPRIALLGRPSTLSSSALPSLLLISSCVISTSFCIN